MINRVILIGNLTRDAETVAASTGRPMTRMRIATNHSWKDTEGNRQESTEFHTVVVFSGLAEVCALYGCRGRRLYVEGRLRTREYESGDGLRRHTTEIVGETIRFLGPRPGDAGDAAADTAENGEAAGEPVALVTA